MTDETYTLHLSAEDVEILRATVEDEIEWGGGVDRGVPYVVHLGEIHARLLALKPHAAV